MSGAPVLRSSALQKALALTPVKGPTASPSAASSGFAATLARAQTATPSSNATSTSRTSPTTASGTTPRISNAAGTTTPGVRRALTQTSAVAPTSVGNGPIPFQAEITAAAKKYGVDPALLAGLVKAESNFNPQAQSGVGAKGLTQLMDATARGLGVGNSFDPLQSLDGGAKFLGGLLKQFHGDESLALAAYNAGPGAVQKFGGIPPYQETQRYVPKVLGFAAQFRRIIGGQ